MALSSENARAGSSTAELRNKARKHLWRHFTLTSQDDARPMKIVVEGEGCFLTDSDGNKYLDGLSGVFCANIGYGFGKEIGAAVADQYERLPYANTWATTYPGAILLAEKIASLSPTDLDHVFFTPSGGEAIEAAWKIARQYFRIRGENRWKAISRDLAYHGTTMGALALLGVSEMRTVFEPVVPGGVRIRNTNRAGRPRGESDSEFTDYLLEDLETRILEQDPTTIAMMVVEPVQNHGGALIPPAGYPEGIRALCDKYGILLVCDETITAWGRLGEWFSSERFGFKPDIITTAKGLSSGYAPIGCAIVSRNIYDTFHDRDVMLQHGMTFGGHPASTAAALKNIEIMERENLCEHVRNHEFELGDKLRRLLDLPVVVDVRGAGYFWAIELASTRRDGTPLSEENLRVLYGDDNVLKPLQANRLLIREAYEGGDILLFIAPPLVASTSEFDHIEAALRNVLAPLGAKLG